MTSILLQGFEPLDLTLSDPEKRVIITCVAWKQYEKLLNHLRNNKYGFFRQSKSESENQELIFKNSEEKFMNILLTSEQEKFIQSQIKNGSYSSEAEVVSAALKLLEEHRRQMVEQKIEQLRAKIASATQQVAQGKVTNGEVVFAKLREKIR